MPSCAWRTATSAVAARSPVTVGRRDAGQLAAAGWTYAVELAGRRVDREPSWKVTTASIVVVPPPGKSVSRASATTRLSVPAGSARWSTPPNSTRRNGSPASSSSGTITAT